MSSWVTEDFDSSFIQEITVTEKMIVDFISLKVMKAGTINSNAIFTIELFNSDDAGTGFNLLTNEPQATITAEFLNAAFTESNYRANYNLNCPGLVLNTNLDGTPKVYLFRFSATNYTPILGTVNNTPNIPINNTFGICKRQADDNSINLTGSYPTGFDTLGLQAIIDPLHIEFGVLE